MAVLGPCSRRELIKLWILVHANWIVLLVLRIWVLRISSVKFDDGYYLRWVELIVDVISVSHG